MYKMNNYIPLNYVVDTSGSAEKIRNFI